MKLNKRGRATKHVISGLIATVLLGMGLNGCDIVMTPTSADIPIVEESIDQQALVMFYVEIPDNTPKDETLLLSVLDEVTGLALNTQRYSMTVIDNRHYLVGVPATLGSVIKYRYSRQGSLLAEEHMSDDRPVRYRLYRVDGPGEVHDVITRWNDTVFNDPTGRITGTVHDAANGKPLANILIAAGGAQALTTGDGKFFIEGLPPGTHNLVAYSLDGSYGTFQQGATVASDSNTQASIQLSLSPRIDVAFLVHVPEGTPPTVPLRMAGNLSTLGNTYANLSGGISTLASEMPTLSLLPDGSFGIILSLPIGSDIRYKFTLGDGFWNAERSTDGAFVTRQILVGEETSVVEDYVQTWSVGTTAPITFDITVPENTPPDEDIYIQFNPYGWTEPIPMWQLSEYRWAYILYSPIDMIGELGYRYCRSGQCGHADDARTPGAFSSGQITHPNEKAIGLTDAVETWSWLVTELPQVDVTDVKVKPRSTDFVTGFEFLPMYHPSWRGFYTSALQDIAARGGNQVIFPSSWTFTRLDPPVLEPVAGQNPLWDDITTTVAQAKDLNLKAALHAIPHFPTAVDAWWSSAPRDFAWWVSWF
ncbi:MAG: carboxypeptidase regulatory-like domain-containing protein, partial [Chloroflexi bacterium]|nr:carboxypeptidase regulatory-like domain-containing protein [Chloroflexota bacterium]